MAFTALAVHRGRLVVRKSRDGSGETGWVSAAGLERHRAEVAWLASARAHPVVRLRAVHPDRPSFVTDYAGTATLWTVGRSPLAAADVVGELCRIVGDLQRDGLIHGNLSCDHVLVRDRRVTLCSPATDRSTLVPDGRGLRTVIDQLVRLWRAGDQPPHTIERWQELAEQLDDDRHINSDRLRALIDDAAAPRMRPAERWRAVARRSTTALGRVPG